MTDTTYTVRRIGGLYPTLQNHVLMDAMQRAREIVPRCDYTPEELAFADKINSQMPGYEKGVTPPMSDDTRPVGTFNNFGSTDYGDVMYICPGVALREATQPTLAPGHHWAVTASVGSSIGMKGMIRIGKLMAIGTYEVMTNPERLAAAKEEFQKATGRINKDRQQYKSSEQPDPSRAAQSFFHERELKLLRAENAHRAAWGRTRQLLRSQHLDAESDRAVRRQLVHAHIAVKTDGKPATAAGNGRFDAVVLRRVRVHDAAGLRRLVDGMHQRVDMFGQFFHDTRVQAQTDEVSRDLCPRLKVAPGEHRRRSRHPPHGKCGDQFLFAFQIARHRQHDRRAHRIAFNAEHKLLQIHPAPPPSKKPAVESGRGKRSSYPFGTIIPSKGRRDA